MSKSTHPTLSDPPYSYIHHPFVKDGRGRAHDEVMNFYSVVDSYAGNEFNIEEISGDIFVLCFEGRAQ